MITTKIRTGTWTILLAIAIMALLTGVGYAQEGSPYDLWSTVDGGGEMSVEVGVPGGYTLAGTAGQPDAGVLTGGGFTLGGGFWGGGALASPPTGYEVYLPLVLR